MKQRCSFSVICRGFVLDFTVPEFSLFVYLRPRVLLAIAVCVITPVVELLHPFINDGVRAFLLKWGL